MNFTDSQDLYIGISNKKDGPMKNSLESRLLFFKNNNLDTKIIISAGLVHQNKVVIVDDLTKSQVVPDCDALITNNRQHLLTVTVSDCVPIYFYDQNKKVVALAHAGWRGITSKIAEAVIDKFITNYHSNPSDIEVFIGPHIKDCHFEVKADVASQFKVSDSVFRDGKIYINLAQVIEGQLFDLGVTNVKVSEECTYCCLDKYFSYRRDKSPELKTMITYLGLK